VTPPPHQPESWSGAATGRASESVGPEVVGPETVGLETVGGANQLRTRSDAQSDGEDVWSCPPEPLAMQEDVSIFIPKGAFTGTEFVARCADIHLFGGKYLDPLVV
jgi:hypothetical protein